MAGQISRINGMKGGRKKGLATIEREKAKEYIAVNIGTYMPQIFQVLLAKALDGDVIAIRELLDRGFGRPTQAVVTKDIEGNEIPFPIYNGASIIKDI